MDVFISILITACKISNTHVLLQLITQNTCTIQGFTSVNYFEFQRFKERPHQKYPLEFLDKPNDC